MALDRSGGITMRMSRRSVLHGIGGVEYSYTGTFDSYGNASQGYLVLKTSGTLSIKGTVDLCLVGGGGKGENAHTSSGGGGGGAGGYVQNYLAQELDDSFTVTIGAGSTGSDGGQSKVGTAYTANGGNDGGGGSKETRYVGGVGRGTAGDGGHSSTPATGGENGIYPWNDSVNFASFQVSGCGGGGGNVAVGGSGGAGGGGNGGSGASSPPTTGTAGTDNTGGGGGGGARRSSSSASYGGNGGTGVVIICWGYNHS